MVSLIGTSNTTVLADGAAVTREVMAFVGLSTDTKPVSTYNGSVIANGSTFLAMNTNKAYMYDEDNAQWHEM